MAGRVDIDLGVKKLISGNIRHVIIKAVYFYLDDLGLFKIETNKIEIWR